MSAAPILVVQHQDECPPAWFGTWLTEAGAVLDVRRPDAGDPLPEDLTEHSGLLVLGGSMGANDEIVAPWLVPVKELVRVAVGSSTPLLGICLGHQVIAAALGGSIAVNSLGKQRGILDLGWTEAAAGDGLFGACPPRAVHWNDDLVTDQPSGATVLATTPNGEVQVLRFADRAWGIQSHPEVDEKVLGDWVAVERSRATRPSAEGLEAFLAEVTAERDSLLAGWRPVGRAFADLCRG